MVLPPTAVSALEKLPITDALEFKSDVADCKPFSHRLCADEACSADATQAGVTLSVAGASTVEPGTLTGLPELVLAIEKRTPFSSFIYIGVYTEKLQGKLAVAKGLVVVCGQEKVKLKAASEVKVDTVALSTNEKISKPLSDVFEVDLSGSLQKPGDCPIVGHEICADIKCAKILKTHPNLSLTNSNYVIDTTKALPKTVFYVGAQTSGGLSTLAVQKLDLLVCGFETISTPLGDKITETAKVADGRFTVDLTTGFATTGGVDCPITSYGLYKDSLGAEEYTNSIVSIDAQNLLTVSPSPEGGLFEFYAVASSKADI